MPAHYDDKNYSYVDYWQNRDYEHQSEILALTRFLDKMSFSQLADIGGGYGRLIPFLSRYTKHITLIEPSLKQLNIAKKQLAFLKNRLTLIKGTAQKTYLRSNSQDLVTVIRVMHHLPYPQNSFTELNRVLKPGGLLVLEFANSHHFKSRIKSYISGQPLLNIPVERRSPSNIRRQTIDFVNHSPQTVSKLLASSGFIIKKTLSVSNFRIQKLKNVLPQKVLLILENYAQSLLSKIYFGPSIFILAQKKSS